jgi:hypothetical protein
MQRQIDQVWRDVRNWEEIAANMWGEASDRKAAIDAAISFTGDHRLYGYWMERVCNEWPISCENALTDPHINQKAWLGHAAVAMALNIPEDITRHAWGFLTDEQKHLANKEAERNIEIWKERYITSKRLCKPMGGQMLF